MAEIHPVEVCTDILRGMRDTEDAVHHIDNDDDIMLTHMRWAKYLFSSASATTTATTTTTSQNHNYDNDKQTEQQACVCGC